MAVSQLGQAEDGLDVHEVSIGSDSLRASLVSYGASLRDLRMAGIGHSLVLGLQDPLHYQSNPHCLGAIVGPVANRISGGFVSISGQGYALNQNENGNTLHGGRLGCGHLNWRLDEASKNCALFSLTFADRHMGFPGPMHLTACYEIDGSTLSLRLSARADQPTVCALAPHSYFNLDGGQTIDNHQLSIFAEHMLPLNQGLPKGAPVAVSGAKDLRQPCPVPEGLDDHFCLSSTRTALRDIARLSAGHVEMTLRSTEAGLQAYDAGFLSDPRAGIDGQNLGRRAGIALEPHAWVDAPNQPWRDQMRLMPDQAITAVTQFAFSKT